LAGLSRSDLLIELDPVPDRERWLEPWSWLLHGRFAARHQNRFGCWFLERPEGGIEMLDVFFGLVDEVAPSFADFVAKMDDPGWREVYLLSDFVARLHEAGKVARGTQVYILAPPPAVNGPDPWGREPLSTAAAMVVDNLVLQSLYSQAARLAREAGSA
jgi:hypothetical protein